MSGYFDKFNAAITAYVNSVQEKRDKINIDVFRLVIDSLAAESASTKSADPGMYFVGGLPVANFYKLGIDGMQKTDGWIFYTPSPVHMGKKILDVICVRESRSHLSRKSFTTYELSFPYKIDGSEFTFTLFLEHVPARFFDTFACFIDAEIYGKKLSLATPDMISAWTYFMFGQPAVAATWHQIHSAMEIRKIRGGSVKSAISYVAPSSVRVEKNDIVFVLGNFIAILRSGKTDCAFGTRTTFKKNVNGAEIIIPIYYVFGEFLSKSPATLLWILYMEKMARSGRDPALITDATNIFANTTVAELLSAECKTSLFDLYRSEKWYDPMKYQREVSCGRTG